MDDSSNYDVGYRIEGIRTKRNISRREFAKQIGASYYEVTAWENGRTNLPSKYLKAICSALNVSADYLLGLSDFPMVLKDKNDSPFFSKDDISYFCKLIQQLFMRESYIRAGSELFLFLLDFINSTVDKWKNGTLEPKLSDVLSMADALHVDVGYLLGRYPFGSLEEAQRFYDTENRLNRSKLVISGCADLSDDDRRSVESYVKYLRFLKKNTEKSE